MAGLETRILKLETAAGPAQPPIASLSDDELLALAVEELVLRGFRRTEAEELIWEWPDARVLIEAAGLKWRKPMEVN